MVPGSEEGIRAPPKIDETAEKLFEEDVKARPAATVSDRRRFLERLMGELLSDSTVWRLLKQLGFSRKKGARGRWNETSG